MHHHIYHTHGFILGSRNKGEANKLLTVYTREMGLIRAMVQGIRLGRSKLRFSLQDFSYAKIDFVRGKDIWRITTASNISSFPFARSNKKSFLFIARISKLIERLCGDEESNQVIFNDFIQALFLLDDTNFKDEQREAIELHLVLRIMNSLGYIGDSKILANYLATDFNDGLIEDLLKERQFIIAHINKALNESQL